MQMEHQLIVTVLAVAILFILTAASGISAANPCIASLLGATVKGDECPGGETVNEIEQNVSTLLQEVARCMLQLGHTPEYPANSCAELAEREPGIPSGNYWILNYTRSPVQVFCEMGEVFPASLNVTGGWMRVANLNMTDPDQQCPENLQRSYTNQSIRLCGKSTNSSCDSVIFTTYGVQYQKVCGRVRGYQFASPDGFHDIDCTANCTIDRPYVDGVSITHGNPRQHIWSYAIGIYENRESDRSTCPCTRGGAPSPVFVGSDYYCESGLNTPPYQSVLYSNDTLWDGQDCDGLERTCCDPPNLPWFCKELPVPTTNDIEFRLCGDESRTNEDIPINLVELYIQ